MWKHNNIKNKQIETSKYNSVSYEIIRKGLQWNSSRFSNASALHKSVSPSANHTVCRVSLNVTQTRTVCLLALGNEYRRTGKHHVQGRGLPSNRDCTRAKNIFISNPVRPKPNRAHRHTVKITSNISTGYISFFSCVPTDDGWWWKPRANPTCKGKYTRGRLTFVMQMCTLCLSCRFSHTSSTSPKAQRTLYPFHWNPIPGRMIPLSFCFHLLSTTKQGFCSSRFFGNAIFTPSFCATTCAPQAALPTTSPCGWMRAQASKSCPYEINWIIHSGWYHTSPRLLPVVIVTARWQNAEMRCDCWACSWSWWVRGGVDEQAGWQV